MRKIDKSKILATAFENDLKIFVAENGKHPHYEKDDTFKRKHYTSVFFNLLACQKGLCVYTEALIASEDLLFDEFWENGIFKKEIQTKTLDGDIEHFNPDLKENQGWEWSNLFLCSTHINRKIKGRNKVDDVFKPDNPNYEPTKYMTFNFKTQLFVPLPKIEDENKELFEKVKNMISSLGINSETIKSRRTEMLLRMKTDIQNKLKTVQYVEKNELKEFFTAFEMSKRYFDK